MYVWGVNKGAPHKAFNNQSPWKDSIVPPFGKALTNTSGHRSKFEDNEFGHQILVHSICIVHAVSQDANSTIKKDGMRKYYKIWGNCPIA